MTFHPKALVSGIHESYCDLRRGGLREVIRKRGWRVVIGVLAYYLVRDTLLYIVLPLLVARGLFAG